MSVCHACVLHIDPFGIPLIKYEILTMLTLESEHTHVTTSSLPTCSAVHVTSDDCC